MVGLANAPSTREETSEGPGPIRVRWGGKKLLVIAGMLHGKNESETVADFVAKLKRAREIMCIRGCDAGEEAALPRVSCLRRLAAGLGRG